MTFLHKNHKPGDVSSSLSFATYLHLLGARSLVQRGHSHPSLHFLVRLVEVLLTELPMCEEAAVSGGREAPWLWPMAAEHCFVLLFVKMSCERWEESCSWDWLEIINITNIPLCLLYFWSSLSLLHSLGKLTGFSLSLQFVIWVMGENNKYIKLL